MTLKSNSKVELAVIANDIVYIKTAVQEINQKLERDYVTRVEFDPLKKVVYGIIALILTGVVGAVLGLIIIK